MLILDNDTTIVMSGANDSNSDDYNSYKDQL